jgi:hypothetical protein
MFWVTKKGQREQDEKRKTEMATVKRHQDMYICTASVKLSVIVDYPLSPASKSLVLFYSSQNSKSDTYLWIRFMNGPVQFKFVGNKILSLM